MWRRFIDQCKQVFFAPSSLEAEQACLRWAESQKGMAILAGERERVARLIAPVLKGYHLLALGPKIMPAIVESSEYSHLFHLCSASGGQARVNFDELPIPSDLVDTVVLHHVIEYSQNPHGVLNEATRVLKPGGHLMIILFNPYSFYGVFSFVMRLVSKNTLWHRHPLRKGRLIDWLKLLNMQPVGFASAGYLLPKGWVNRWKNHRVVKFVQRRNQLPFGAYQIILAKKVIARPIKTRGLSWHVLPTAKRATPQILNPHKKEIDSIERN